MAVPGSSITYSGLKALSLRVICLHLGTRQITVPCLLNRTSEEGGGCSTASVDNIRSYVEPKTARFLPSSSLNVIDGCPFDESN